MANFFPDFLLSLPRPFSDFRSAPVALWLFIVTPILVGCCFYLISKHYKSPQK
ncbi:MAG: hypothetical protein ACTTH6_01010 [Candidatus Altimarinota bacterium]